MNKHLKILNSLYELAKENTGIKGSKLACMIIPRNHEPVVGFNQRKSHPLQSRFSPREQAIFLHAEIDAIRGCLNKMSPSSLRGATMYISRAKQMKPKSGWTWGLAKPCPGCARAIESYGILTVYYTTDTMNQMEGIDYD